MASLVDNDRTTIPIGRLIIRAARLSSPLILVLLGLLVTSNLTLLATCVALFVGFALGGLLAFFREKRLHALEGRLCSLMGVEPPPPGDFEILGGDALPVMINQVEESLNRMRGHHRELDLALRTLLDALPDPVLLVNADRRIERANVATAKLLEREVTGQHIEGGLRDPGILSAIDDTFTIGEGAEVNLQLSGPPSRAFGGQVVPIRWHRGRAVLITLRELTEQVMIERMRADFVANASHELRTPLTVLRGFIETLQGAAKDDPEAQTRFLGTMEAEAERMSRLINDLLSLSRIEQNEHVLPDEVVDLDQVLRNVIDALKGYARDRNVTLVADIPSDLPDIVGDFDQLSQLFTNLIDNGIKYGGNEGEVRVAAEFHEVMPSGAGALSGRAAVEVKIIDNGPGIAAENLPRLTERFFRVDPAHSRHLGSTGLGLAIVKHILRRHRGHINIESEVDKGTVFKIYLKSAD
ncbi:MAG: sensor histidine kinase [Geminicoccales bacterium]